MEMNFLTDDTRASMAEALTVLADVYPPFKSQPMTMLAGRAEASLGDYETCLESPPGLAQYVVPHFNNRALSAYLSDVPRGLPGCLIPKRPRQMGHLVGHFFPSGACRQLLLKSVSERCCTLQVVFNWQAVTAATTQDNVQNQQTVSYASMLAVKDFQSHWNDFQQEIHYHLMSLNALDADDLLHLQSLIRFLHDNGLIAQMEMPLEQIFKLFFCDAASVVPTLHLGPKTHREVCEWANLFFLWITVESFAWPNRQLYTSAMAYLQYSYIQGRCQPPLKGMSPQNISTNLLRAMRYSRLESMTLLANLEQSQFRAPSQCWLDLRHRVAQAFKLMVKELGEFDAIAFPPPLSVTKMSVLLHQQESIFPFLQQDQPEAAFFLKMAEAESSSQMHRHYDVLHTLAELLANYHYPPNTDAPLALHPKQLLPDLYLLLGKTLAAVHASDDTVVACLQQARLLIDQDKPPTSEVDTRHESQLALAILTVLNKKGFLQQAGLFFQHVMEENGPTLLKQSSVMHDFCVEYLQNTVFAWLENQMAFLLGFHAYHRQCQHSAIQLKRAREGNTDSLLHRMCATVNEVKDLIALNQRFLRTGNLALSVNTCPWGVYGTAGQETTLECLFLKARFYEWLIRFISTRTFGFEHNPTYIDQLTLLTDQYQSWARIMPSDHPLYLEVATIAIALDAAWDCINDGITIYRTDHSSDKLADFVHHLDVQEARSGTRFSLECGDLAFKIYIWMSVNVAFSGNGKHSLYNTDMLRKAGLNYLRASRGLSYRLPIISLLLDHLGWCSQLAVNDNKPDDEHSGSGKVFPSPQTGKENCQCKDVTPVRAKRPIQSHEENHTAESRAVIFHGFRKLGNFPLKNLLLTRQKQQQQQCTPDAHNAFLLNQLLRGPDGPVLAKAINYASHACIRARKEQHPKCVGQ